MKEDVTRSFSIDERTITWPEFCNIKVITTEFRNISEQRTPNLLLRNQVNYLQPLVTSDLDRSLLNFSPKESDSSKWEPTYMNTTSNVLHNSLSRLQEMQPSSRDLNDSQNSTWKSVLSFQLIWRGSNQKRIWVRDVDWGIKRQRNQWGASSPKLNWQSLNGSLRRRPR